MSHRIHSTHEAHDLSCEEFDELLTRANGRCEVCGIPQAEAARGLLYIDHDNRRGTGKDHIRGMTCPKCNGDLRFIDSGAKTQPSGPLDGNEQTWPSTRAGSLMSHSSTSSRVANDASRFWYERETLMDFNEEDEVSVAIERRLKDSSPRYIAGHTAMLIEQIRRHYGPGGIHKDRHPVVYEDSKELGES